MSPIVSENPPSLAPCSSRRFAWLTTARLVSLALFTLASAVLQYWDNAYRSPLVRYPDEPAHFVTALMIHEYLLHPTVHMVRFAEQYYLHYPEVAIGHWPPVLHFILGLWMVPFGATTTAALLLFALLSGFLVLFTGEIVARYVGRPYAFPAALFLLFLSITRAATGMIMTELPLALWCLVACVSCASFFRSSEPRYMRLFALFATLAILTKADGICVAAVPAAGIVLRRKFNLLRKSSYWVPWIAVALLCGSYTLLTYRLAAHGWSAGQHYSTTFILSMLAVGLADFFKALGVTGTILLVAGIWSVMENYRHRDPVDPIWPILISFVAVLLIFESAGPWGMEPRKLFPLVAPSVVLIAAGSKWIIIRLQRLRVPTLAGAALLGFLVAIPRSAFALPPRHDCALLPAARRLARLPELEGAAILVAGDHAGAFIAAIADADHHPRHYVLRSTKHLLKCGWSGRDCVSRFEGIEQLRLFLDKVPVSGIVTEQDKKQDISIPGLLAVARSNPAWEQLSDGAVHIFVNRTAGRNRQPPLIQSDLTNKIGRVISTNQ